jgi:hypothetical protein
MPILEAHMVRLPFRLLADAMVTRRTLLWFTLASAILNGLVTASVGAWIGQKVSTLQTQRQSVGGISTLFYERRIRAGMVVSSIRRGADAEELRQRKRAYDDSFVDWNKSIRQNLFAIREVLGHLDISSFEMDFQELLVRPLSLMDACLTKAYDLQLAGKDGRPELETCRWSELYQLSLDCGASYTNELYKMTRVSFNPLRPRLQPAELSEARARVNRDCTVVPTP